MKVVVTFPIPDAAKQIISEHALLQCWESEESIPTSTLIGWATDADAILTTLTCPIDSELLGGVVIRTEDTVIDDSVRGKLNKLAGILR